MISDHAYSVIRHFHFDTAVGIDHKVFAAARNVSGLCSRSGRNRQSQAQIFLAHDLSHLFRFGCVC